MGCRNNGLLEMAQIISYGGWEFSRLGDFWVRIVRVGVFQVGIIQVGANSITFFFTSNSVSAKKLPSLK